MENALNKTSRFSSLKTALIKYLPSVIFGAVVMKIIISEYVLNDNYLLYCSFAVYEGILFFVFEKLKPKKKLRGLVYILLMAFVIFLCAFIVRKDVFLPLGDEFAMSVSEVRFTDWFYLNILNVGFVPSYVGAMYLGLGFFLTSIIYYFTVIRYRTFGMLLVTLFPFVIYGRRSQAMDEFDITLMITLFLVLIVHSRLVADDIKENKAVINASYGAVVALFVTFVGAVTMFVPKPEIESKLEQDNEFFSFFKTKIQRTDYDDLSNVSSKRYGENPTGEILFYCNTNFPQQTIYLKNQSFDVFRNNQWEKETKFTEYEKLFDDDNLNNYYWSSADFYISRMKSFNKTGEYTKYGLTDELFSNNPFSTDALMTMFSDTFAPSYLPVPLMVKTDTLTDEYSVDNRGTVTCYKSNQSLNSSFHYTVEGDAEIRYAQSLPWDWEEFLHLLSDAKQNGDIPDFMYQCILRKYMLYTEVSDCSDNMISLAQQITENCKNDYEKAKAIVDYFENSGFVYDMDYVPEDDSIDYFLFNSKKGSCTSYATAMTLMSRIVGLPARYVEGFATSEIIDGNYVVRDANAHAFVEVYISGLGWMTFDPTVPGYMNIRQQQMKTEQGGVSETVKLFVKYFSRIVLFLAVVFVLIFIVFIDRITEVFFRINLKFRKYPDRVILIYRRIMKLLEKSSKERLKGLTPQKLADYAKNKKNAEIGMIVSLFEKVCFGGYIPQKTEYDLVYRIYKENWKCFIRKKKKIKS